MKIRAVWLCGMLLVCTAAPIQADEVDDLLAGKPVVVPPAEDLESGTGSASQSATLEGPFIDPLESPPVVQESPWDVVIGPQSATGAQRAASRQDDAKQHTPLTVQLVPEPPAIALAVGALLYFLIFFRRWQVA